MFEGFETRRIALEGVTLNTRLGGEGPPLLLLHGYPQSHAAWHRVAPVAPRPGPERAFDVVGGGCEPGDAFARDRALPPPEPGDLLAVLDAGAYGYSMASNVNLRPRPAEVVIRDGAAVLARAAETPADLAARALGAWPAGVPA